MTVYEKILEEFKIRKGQPFQCEESVNRMQELASSTEDAVVDELIADTIKAACKHSKEFMFMREHLRGYCTKAVTSGLPEWAVIAKLNGWTKPHEGYTVDPNLYDLALTGMFKLGCDPMGGGKNGVAQLQSIINICNDLVLIHHIELLLLHFDADHCKTNEEFNRIREKAKKLGLLDDFKNSFPEELMDEIEHYCLMMLKKLIDDEETLKNIEDFQKMRKPVSYASAMGLGSQSLGQILFRNIVKGG